MLDIQKDKKMKYELKKNCIYCFGEITKRTKGHIIPKSIGGNLIYPLACKHHNNLLGGTVETYLSKDYWVNFAKVKLGLKGFKINPAFELDKRRDKHLIEVLGDGEERDVPPITDKMTWRIIAKIAYESVALFVGEDVFSPAFDEYRKFVLSGQPDLAWKRILRCCYDLPWAPGHVIEFSPNEESFAVTVRLFNAYMFKATFWHTIGDQNIFPGQVIIDLNTKKTAFRKLSAGSTYWQYVGAY